MLRLQEFALARLRKAVWLVPAFVFAACGGGGGSGGGDLGPSTATPLALTTANQKPAAADALDTASNVSVAVVALDLLPATQLASSALASRPSAVSVLASSLPVSRALALGAAVNVPFACESGSASITGQVANPALLAAGDTLLFSASHCTMTVDGSSATMDGTLRVTVVGGSLNTQTLVYPIHLVLDVQAVNLMAATGGRTDVTTGQERVEIIEDSATSGRMIVSGGSMITTATTSTGSHTSSFGNFSQTLTHSGNVVTLTAAGQVETNNPALGYVAYGLDTPAAVNVVSGVFSAGALRLYGSNSALVMNVTGPDLLRLDLDDDGDGSTEAQTTSSPDELSGYL